MARPPNDSGRKEEGTLNEENLNEENMIKLTERCVYCGSENHTTDQCPANAATKAKPDDDLQKLEEQWLADPNLREFAAKLGLPSERPWLPSWCELAEDKLERLERRIQKLENSNAEP